MTPQCWKLKKNEWTELLKRTKIFGFDIYIYLYGCLRLLYIYMLICAAGILAL